jgi:hypothetical protein
LYSTTSSGDALLTRVVLTQEDHFSTLFEGWVGDGQGDYASGPVLVQRVRDVPEEVDNLRRIEMSCEVLLGEVGSSSSGRKQWEVLELKVVAGM